MRALSGWAGLTSMTRPPRSILRNGWGMARQMFEYEAAWSGVMMVMLAAVSPAYTSQARSSCGHTAAENRKTQAISDVRVRGPV